jgi:uncharacterized membrane protein YraQ (UPF0718 family)
MNEAVDTINRVLWRKHKRITIIVFACLMTAFTWPQAFIDTTSFVLMGMLSVSVLVVPGILISAWVNASGSSSYIKRAFEGNKVRAIFAASLIGAITPVCGVTVLPLMVGLLSSGIPLAPVMAFWLSSPITDPANFFVTAATLGFHFAIAKIIAALLTDRDFRGVEHCYVIRSTLDKITPKKRWSGRYVGKTIGLRIYSL